MSIRLTLRTLLSYLDDALDARQTRQIGEKLADSPVAQELTEKINRVVRRRSIAVPPLTAGSGPDDPNTVAEYLDNCLPAEEVERIETNALESDVHLCEIASCHQTLSLVEGEPAHVPPTARQRMYQLVKGRESVPYRKPTAQPAVPSIDPEVYDYEHQEAEETLLLGLPAYARQKSWWRRLAPVAVFLLLVVGLILTIQRAVPSVTTEGPATGPNVPELALLTSTDTGPRPRPPVDTGTVDAGQNPEVTSPEKLDTMPEVVDAGGDPMPMVEPGPMPMVEPNQPIAPPIEEPSTARVAVGKLTSQQTVLVTRETSNAPWRRVAFARPEIFSTDGVMSLPGYHTEVTLDSGVKVELWGDFRDFLGLTLLESRVEFHEPQPSIAADLTLKSGRIYLTNWEGTEPVWVRLRFGEEVWDITLPDSQSEVLVDLYSRYDEGVGFNSTPGGEEPKQEVILGVTRGKASVTIGDQRHVDLAAPHIVYWDSKAAGSPTPQPLQEVPVIWRRTGTTAAGVGVIVPDSDAALSALNQRLSAPTANVSTVLSEMRTGEEEPIGSRMLAVLATQAIGNLGELVDALGDPELPGVREAAAIALRHWTGQDVAHDLQLHQVLTQQKRYDPRHADQLLSLLHPFTQGQLEDAEVYSGLVEDLDHEKVAIRHLAFRHLIQFDQEAARQPEKFAFDAGAPDDLRKIVVDAWRLRAEERRNP